MAKKGDIERNRKVKRLVAKYAGRRARLKAILRDSERSNEEKFQARLKLAQLPRNSAPTRIRNRCELSGRARGYYRKFRLSRIWLREMALRGHIPGMVKSSW